MASIFLPRFEKGGRPPFSNHAFATTGSCADHRACRATHRRRSIAPTRKAGPMSGHPQFPLGQRRPSSPGVFLPRAGLQLPHLLPPVAEPFLSIAPELTGGSFYPMNALTLPTPRTQGGRRPGAGRPRKTMPPAHHRGDEAPLNFESPAPPLTSGRASKLTYHVVVNLTRRQDRMELAMARISTVLDSVDCRLSRLEERACA
jgi:hypothetical protein